MPTLFGKKYTKREMLQRVGDMAQLADAREMELSSGRGRGVRVIEVSNGTGLRFSVLPDRGMDIVWAEYRGIPISFYAKAGVTSPYFFSNEDYMKNFFGGLLTTGGLTYMGAKCVDEGQALGLHGRVNSLPAADVSVSKAWDGEDYVLRVRGQVEESRLYGEKMVLTREITTRMGENIILLRDTVENQSFTPQPLMMLYHFNFGFPLVDDGTTFHTSCTEHLPRDEQSKVGLAHYEKLGSPTPGFLENVFYHSGGPREGFGEVVNPALGLRVRVTFDTEQLPILNQWKLLGEGDYVLGIEPGTWRVEGRAEARRQGALIYLNPLETKVFELAVRIQG